VLAFGIRETAPRVLARVQRGVPDAQAA